MSTRATITLKMKQGGYKSIYLHFDGYEEYAGAILREHYNTYEKVEQLIALGDLSSIGCLINPTTSDHSWNNPEPNVCVAYHRDRGEDWEDTKPVECQRMPATISKWKYKQEYNYIFVDEKWTMKKG